MLEKLKKKAVEAVLGAAGAPGDTDIAEKIPRSKEDLEVEDPNPGTFINEALWKKVFFKILGYLVYILGISLVIINGVFVEPYVDSGKFITGVTVIILPVIWGAFDAQARNREIQEKLAADKKIAASRQEAIDAAVAAEKEIAEHRTRLMEKQQEIYRLKALLMAKTDNVSALDDACTAADALKGGELR